MTTNRRHFLRFCGVTGIGAFAGCADESKNDKTPTSTQVTATPSSRQGTDATDSTTWTQEASLTTEGAGQPSGFGESVALSGNSKTALLGATGDAINGNNAGSAYVFTRDGGSWRQQAKLLPNDGDTNDLFGTSVALSTDGTRALIGANSDEDPNGKENDVFTGAGAAYVFEKSGNTWSQQAKIAPADGEPNDRFGIDVSLSNDGDTALIGAYADDTPTRGGSAYVFRASNGTWRREARLSPVDGDYGEQFGWSVSLSGDGTSALIGAYGAGEPNGSFAGAAYIFSLTDGSWAQQDKLSADDGDSNDRFGWAVALSDTGIRAVIGSSADQDPNGDAAGTAYVFDATDNTWTQTTKIIPNDGDAQDYFAGAVGLSGDGSTIVCGAANDEDPNGEDSGSAYVFGNAGGSWKQVTKLAAPEGTSSSSFGTAVGIADDGEHTLFGSPLSAHVFTIEES